MGIGVYSTYVNQVQFSISPTRIYWRLSSEKLPIDRNCEMLVGILILVVNLINNNNNYKIISIILIN